MVELRVLPGGHKQYIDNWQGHVMNKSVPILLLVVLFAVAVWYSFIKEPDPVHELPPTLLPPIESVELEKPEPFIQDSIDEVAVEAMQVAPPMPPEPPGDEAIRQALADITGTSATLAYIIKDELISRLVATIDSLTSRQVPPLVNPVKPVSGTLDTEPEGDRIRMSENNYSRYEGYIALLQSADSDLLVGFYETNSRWFQEAWEENGGEGLFNDRLLEVLAHLLQTPDVAGPIYLSKPEAVYLLEDPDLEAMTAGQKILLRMGSANAAIVKQKLQELHTILGM